MDQEPDVAEAAENGTQTIYARVPVATKAAVDTYAQETGKTLAGAVSELLSRGLTVAPDTGGEMKISRLELDLATLLLRLQQIQVEHKPENFIWNRIFTCDVPRLTAYLSPDLQERIVEMTE